MADSSNAKTPTQGPPRKISKEPSKISVLLHALLEVAKDVEGIRDYSNLVEDNKKLEEKLKEQANQISQLSNDLEEQKVEKGRARSSLLSSFGDEYTEYKKQLAVAEKTGTQRQKIVTDLETKLKSSRAEVGQLQKQLEGKKKETEHMKEEGILHRSKLKAAQDDCGELQEELNLARRDLGDFFFHNIDNRAENLRTSLEELSMSSYKIVKEFMSETNPELNTCNLRVLGCRLGNLPISAEITPESFLMRRAAGQSIISQILMEHIFRTFYTTIDSQKKADDMLGFFAKHKEQELTYRYQIHLVLGTEEMKETEVGESAAATAANEVSGLLHFLVPEAKRDEFRRKVRVLMSNASKIWVRECQKATSLFEVRDPSANDTGVKTYPDFPMRQNGLAKGSDSRIVATLFPRITADGEVLHPGAALFYGSPVAIVAKTQLPPSPPQGRNGGFPRRERQNSVSNSNGAGWRPA